MEKPLEDEVKEDGRLGADAVSFAIHRQKVLDALVVRGFAEKHPQNESIRFNQMGLFAGKILKETNHLKTPFKYRAWTVIWWIILIFATIIVLGQTVTAVKIIIKSFSI